MEYEFEPGLIDEPEQYDVGGLVPPGTLSKADKEWALKWYPPPKPKPKVLAALPVGGDSIWPPASKPTS